MLGWYVRLEGDEIDLQDLAERFSVPDWTVVEHEGHYYLKCDTFDSCSTDQEVRAYAMKLILVINGFAMARFGDFQPVRIGAVVRFHDDGRKDAFVSLANAVTFRTRLSFRVGGRAVSAETGLPSPQAVVDPWPEIVKKAQLDPHVKEALYILGSRPHNWVELFKVYEHLRAVAGDQKGLANLTGLDKKEIERFCGTAHNPDPSAAGREARHGVQTKPPPNNPMSLQEGEAFIRDMLERFLQALR